MSFTYHNERTKYCVDQMLKELKDCCDGKNLSVTKLAAGDHGYYDEAKLERLVKELALADHPDSEQSVMNEESLQAEEDYVSTLLYVMIRAMQAGIGHVVWNDKFIPAEPVTEDTFAEIIKHLEGNTLGLSDKEVRFSLLTDSMRATILTVYHLLTGEEATLPDPYVTPKKKEKEEASETETAEEQDEADSEPEDYSDLDLDDPGLFDYPPDEDDYYPYSSMEEKRSAEYYFSLRDAEQETYYHGDPMSHADWEKYLSDPYYENLEERRKIELHDLSDPAEKATYDQEKERLKIFFRNPEKYVERFERLSLLTEKLIVEKDQRKTVQSWVENIPKKIDCWLKDHDLSVYSDDNIAKSITEYLYAAAKEIRTQQEKRL